MALSATVPRCHSGLFLNPSEDSTHLSKSGIYFVSHGQCESWPPPAGSPAGNTDFRTLCCKGLDTFPLVVPRTQTTIAKRGAWYYA